MHGAQGFWRRVYWLHHASGDQVLLGVMVADNNGGIATRMVPDLSRASAFSDFPEDGLRKAVEDVFSWLQDGDALFRYTAYPHAMSCIRVGEPLYTLITDPRTVDVAADDLVEALTEGQTA